MGYPYSGYHTQADKYGRRTEDCPIDADYDGSKIRVPKRRYGLRLIGHDNSRMNSETDGRTISRSSMRTSKRRRSRIKNNGLNGKFISSPNGHDMKLPKGVENRRGICSSHMR